jgi:hypothetical protein
VSAPTTRSFFFSAAANALANLLVVNHALFVSDLR